METEAAVQQLNGGISSQVYVRLNTCNIQKHKTFTAQTSCMHVRDRIISRQGPYIDTCLVSTHVTKDRADSDLLVDSSFGSHHRIS